MGPGNSRLFRATPAAYSFGLAAVVFGPLFAPGYLLLRDAVSTPRSYLTDSALGLGDAAPRAVPQDALLAVASTVVDGGIVVKLILFASLWLAGLGAARMVETVLEVGIGPQLLATTVVVWNPYVAERLLQGHWSLLAGYAALPWVVSAAVRIRGGGGTPAWCALAVCLAAAGLTPTGGLLAAIVALAVVRGRRTFGVAALAVLASAPWLTAALVSGSGTGASDPAGVAAFAARAEPGLGTIGSLLGLGGIWNSTAVPDSRTGLFALVGTVLLLAVVAVGVPALIRRKDATVIALAVLGVASVLFGTLAATRWGIEIGEWTVAHVPGTGLLRDAQKWVALVVPVYALAAAAGCADLMDRVRASAAVPIAAVAIALISLPDLAWGVGGELRPVHYPSSWQAVAATLESTDDDGDVAVLPAGMFRIFEYSGRAPVLDPAPRMLPRDVLQTGELVVAGGSVGGEGGRAAKVEALLLGGGSARELGGLGVTWVLVERTTAGPVGESARTLADLSEVYADDQLALYRVPGGVAMPGPSRIAVVTAHVVWAGVLAGGLVGLGLGFRRRRSDQS